VGLKTCGGGRRRLCTRRSSLAGRAPDFNKLRKRDQKVLAEYLDGYERDMNAPQALRRKRR